MKKVLFAKISTQVVAFLIVVSLVAFISIWFLDHESDELREEIQEELMADSIMPYMVGEITDMTNPEEEPADTDDPSDSEESTGVDDGTEASSDEESSEDGETEDSSDEESSEDDETEDPVEVESSQVATTPAPTAAPTQAPTPTPIPTPTPTPTKAPTPTPTPMPAMADPVPIAVTEDRTYITDAQMAVFKKRLLDDINALRASYGLGSVSSNACLQSGAIVRSKEIVTNWSHTRPNGDRGVFVLADCGGWYADAKYRVLNKLPHQYALGENLAVAYSLPGYSGTDEEIIGIADYIFENWKASPTHLENMVNGLYTSIGIGVTVTIDDGDHAFWTCTLYSN